LRLADYLRYLDEELFKPILGLSLAFAVYFTYMFVIELKKS